jgi:hypothetical protein
LGLYEAKVETTVYRVFEKKKKKKRQERETDEEDEEAERDRGEMEGR